jgi:hypothetical protein
LTVSTFVELYIAWGGPNVIAALAAGTIAWWLLNTSQRSIQHYLFSVGAGAIGVMIIAAIAALLGLQPVQPGGMIGVLAGVASAFLARAKA